MNCLAYITALIGGKWDFVPSEEYLLKYPIDVVDLREGVPGGESSKKKEELPEYQQIHRLHKSLLPNLSIFDVLCHIGPETKSYLARYANKLYENP